MFYWLMKYVVIGPLVRLLFRPWAEGLENIPERGPVILAANHLSFLDSIFVPLLVPRRVVYLGKSDYFGKWYSWFFRGAGVIPVRREGGEASDAALNAGVEQLDLGLAVGIYPEGTRSPDGKLYRGKTGVARMSLRAGAVPVVPVALIGTFEVQPPGRFLPKIRRVGIRFGRPLDFTRYEGKEDDRFVLRSMTDELMYELMLLSGQEYVDEYAAKVKERMKAERAGAAGAEPERETAGAA